jgi:hypothetical protein
MNYYHKYLKYKNKYINLVNLQGGSLVKNVTQSQINEIVKEDRTNGQTKTYILAHVLKEIMDRCGIPQNQYMIIAGYCLKNLKEVGDLDVIVTPTAYERLKSTGLFDVLQAKISKTERLVVKLEAIGPDAEIEIFGSEPTTGFPTDDFSLVNLQKTNALISDEFGNMYYGTNTCIELYSNLEKIDNKYIIFGTFEIDEQRVRKNISHLKTIRDGYSDFVIKSLCQEKIDNLEKILS